MHDKLTKLAVAAVALGTVFGLSACGRGVNSGSGQATGLVTQIGPQKNFAWCKTTEGTLNIPNAGGSAENSIFHFSVLSPAIARKLEQAKADGHAVRIAWNERTFPGVCTMATRYLVTGVEEVRQAATPEGAAQNSMQREQKRGYTVSGPVHIHH